MNCHVAKVAQTQDICQSSISVMKQNSLFNIQKTFLKQDYPTLPTDMAKITSRDGTNIYLPVHKLEKLISKS